ncbi:MAG: DUF7008 domain-containing protein, partial [Terriglobia bacterium]
QKYLRLYATGEDVRDWEVCPSAVIVFPYDGNLDPLPEPLPPALAEFLAPYRPRLENLIISGTTPKKETNLKWFEYRRLARAKLRAPRNAVFPQIAVYNHCYLSGHAVLFKEKAQAIALKADSASEIWLGIAALLNSSSVLFSLKQVCFSKREAREAETGTYYEFSGNNLEQLNVPERLTAHENSDSGPALRALTALAAACCERGDALSRLTAKRLLEKPGEAYDGWHRALPSYTPPHPLIAQPFDSAQDLLALKAKAKEERERLRRGMIALQEEMDWLVYAAYGLLPEDHPAIGLGVMDAAHPWEVALGQRPFELLAIHAGPPADWDEARKRLWQARTEAIQTNEHIARIEQPVYKRRWVPPDYEKEFAEAFKWWLREKAEFHLEHDAKGGPVSLEEWAVALWKDPRVRAAAEVYHGGGLLNAGHFEHILKEAFEEETVPDDETAFKARHRQLRGKLNVPRERFRSLTGKPGYYVWAGQVSV